MSRFIPLNPEHHLNHGWKRFDSMTFAAGDTCAPVLLAELKMLLPHYALAFIRNGDDGFMPVALQGLFAQENLLIGPQGKWRAPYVPSVYRGYPFMLHQIEHEGEPRGVLCFDTESGLYREQPDNEAGEERFFDEEAKLSSTTRGVLDFLAQRHRNQVQTQAATDTLAELGLLKPIVWPFASPDSGRELARGFYSVDEQVMLALPDESLLRLARQGGLLLAHAQLLSVPRLSILQQLHTLRWNQPRGEAALEGVEEESVEALFGENDDTLKFDF